MIYIVEAVQRNRVVKLKARSADYDEALDIFDRTKKLPYRETRFFRSDEIDGKVLLKCMVRDNSRNVRVR